MLELQKKCYLLISILRNFVIFTVHVMDIPHFLFQKLLPKRSCPELVFKNSLLPLKSFQGWCLKRVDWNM